ncbi:hypothetical protein GN244_ATG09464 [Phytophthora infestans]|uniref:Uncharacterized protein n=1 Tax=Phytophthora infestans TaxID=4787 RepID=A0A833WDN7_PHYIN|nr:hypothetical protein GN244_ATG09464 [Phytophthora infestans]KAF4143367.1 hypothetical protein GN958_ATG07433 [Phytophthora infestans]
MKNLRNPFCGGDTIFYKSVAEQLENRNNAEDVQIQDAVEGDDIFQVLLISFRQRSGTRQYIESDTDVEDEFERDDDVLSRTRWSRDKFEEIIFKTQYPDEATNECSEEASPNLLTVLRWVGTLLLGISILLTWPIILAYLQG